MDLDTGRGPSDLARILTPELFAIGEDDEAVREVASVWVLDAFDADIETTRCQVSWPPRSVLVGSPSWWMMCQSPASAPGVRFGDRGHRITHPGRRLPRSAQRQQRAHRGSQFDVVAVDRDLRTDSAIGGLHTIHGDTDSCGVMV